MKAEIGDRLDIYGAAICPACDNRFEVVFTRQGRDLICRNHPGHPLFDARGKHEASPAPLEDTREAPASLVAS